MCRSERDKSHQQTLYCSDECRDVVYKEIKHLTLLLNVEQVVQIYEVYEKNDEIYIVMEVRQLQPVSRARVTFERENGFVMQLCKGGELHANFVGDGDEDVDGNQERKPSKNYTYGEVGQIAICMLKLACELHSNGMVHCASAAACNKCIVLLHGVRRGHMCVVLCCGLTGARGACALNATCSL
jgi:hypothetical protein